MSCKMTPIVNTGHLLCVPLGGVIAFSNGDILKPVKPRYPVQKSCKGVHCKGNWR